MVPITATGPVVVRAVARIDGAVICAGEFAGTLAIGEVRARAAGGRDGFVARLDDAGEPAWIKTVGGAGDDRITAVAAREGVLAVGGEIGGRVAVDKVVLDSAARPDGFVALVSPADAAIAWAVALGASRYSGVASVALAGDGGVIAAGQFAGGLTANGAEVYSAGNQDLFVARFADGKLAWLRRGGGPGADVGSAVAVAADDAIAFAGSFMDGAAFGAELFETVGEEPDVVIGRLSGDGRFAWVKQLGGAGYDSASGIAVAENRIVAVGRFARDLAGAGATLASAGKTDGFVVTLNADGSPFRSHDIGGPGADWLAAVAAGDGVVVAGGFAERIGGDLQSAGGVDGMVAKLAGTQTRWQRGVGGPGDDAITAAAIGERGEVAIAGSFSRALTLDGVKLDAGDEVGGFVALLEP